MKKFRVVFIKIESGIVTGQRGPMQLAEQNFFTDKKSIDIAPPVGYSILSITELLPDINQFKDGHIKNAENISGQPLVKGN